jgi:aspartate ammonia-lyase
MKNPFKRGTHGWALEENRQELKRMRQHIQGMNLGDNAAGLRLRAADALTDIIVAVAKSVCQQMDLHPEDLEEAE